MTISQLAAGIDRTDWSAHHDHDVRAHHRAASAVTPQGTENLLPAVHPTVQRAADSPSALLPSVADLLCMPAMQRGRPKVIAGAKHLERRVRWLHISELDDIHELLRGGELILTTGIALPDSPDFWNRYVSGLAGAGASGLILEYGRRYETAPPSLIKACTRHAIPLITLCRPVEFMALTEAVHARILEHQMASLRLSERAHEVFAELALSGADLPEIVRAAAELTGAAFVFEDQLRRVVACAPATTPIDELLDRWSERSRKSVLNEPVGVCGPEEWAVASVAVAGSCIGRLVCITQERPTHDHLVVAKRAATALSLHRISSREHDPVELLSQRSILSDIIHHRYSRESEIYARIDAAGASLRNHRAFTGALVRITGQPHRGKSELMDLPRAIIAAARYCEVPVLLTPWASGVVGVLVALPDKRQRGVHLAGLAQEIHRRCGSSATARISVGSTVERLSDVHRTFHEAAHVDRTDSTEGRPYRELPEVGMRGLFLTLAGDPRLQAFIARTLDPILEHDVRHGTKLLQALRTYLGHRGNKSEAARAASMSRATFYERLDTISRLLNVDLTSGEICTTLHAAVMAMDSEVDVEFAGQVESYTPSADAS